MSAREKIRMRYLSSYAKDSIFDQNALVISLNEWTFNSKGLINAF